MAQDGLMTAITPRRFGSELEIGRDDVALELSAAIRTIDLENRRMRAEMAKRLGLNDNEFGALAYISEMDQPTPKSLVTELNLTTGAVTAMIDRLEATGLIVRRSHPSDRRSTVLALTPDGELVREWIYGTYRQSISAAIRASDEECVRTAVDILLRASAHIRSTTVHLEDRVPGLVER